MTEEQPAKRSTFDDPVLTARTAAIFRRAHDRRLAAEAISSTDESQDRQEDARSRTEDLESKPSVFDDPVRLAHAAAIFRRAWDRYLVQETMRATETTEGATDAQAGDAESEADQPLWP